MLYALCYISIKFIFVTTIILKNIKCNYDSIFSSVIFKTYWTAIINLFFVSDTNPARKGFISYLYPLYILSLAVQETAKTNCFPLLAFYFPCWMLSTAFWNTSSGTKSINEVSTDVNLYQFIPKASLVEVRATCKLDIGKYFLCRHCISTLYTGLDKKFPRTALLYGCHIYIYRCTV